MNAVGNPEPAIPSEAVAIVDIDQDGDKEVVALLPEQGTPEQNSAIMPVMTEPTTPGTQPR